MSLKTLNESLEKMLLLETRQDIENFKNKFGEENYELFNKSLQRLKNNGYSTDIIYYTQKVSKEELEDLLYKLQRKLKVNSTNKNDSISSEGIRGKYKYLGESKGYKVYQPLDYLASVDLGYMSGWCTAGRYGHSGEKNFKASEEEAKKHFEDYTINKQGKLYYFLDSKTMEGKYAIVVYPKTLKVNKIINNYYVQKTNFELFNQKDMIDYSALDKIPYELVDGIFIETAFLKNGLFIKDQSLLKVDTNLEEINIPNNIKYIEECAFASCEKIKKVTLPDSIISIGEYAFQNCINLTSIIIPNSVIKMGYGIFWKCWNLKEIILPNKLTYIPTKIFKCCDSLKSVKIPKNITYINWCAFEDCHNLKDVYYEGTEEEWNKIEILSDGNKDLLNATIHFNGK